MFHYLLWYSYLLQVFYFLTAVWFWFLIWHSCVWVSWNEWFSWFCSVLQNVCDFNLPTVCWISEETQHVKIIVYFPLSILVLGILMWNWSDENWADVCVILAVCLWQVMAIVYTMQTRQRHFTSLLGWVGTSNIAKVRPGISLVFLMMHLFHNLPCKAIFLHTPMHVCVEMLPGFSEGLL